MKYFIFAVLFFDAFSFAGAIALAVVRDNAWEHERDAVAAMAFILLLNFVAVCAVFR